MRSGVRSAILVRPHRPIAMCICSRRISKTRATPSAPPGGHWSMSAPPPAAPPPLQPGDVPDTVADVTELQRIVGYKPKVTVEEGVKNFVDWYRGYYGV